MREDKPGKSRGGGGVGKRLGKSRRAKKV